MMQRRISSCCKASIFLLHPLLAGLSSSPTIEVRSFLIPGQPLYDDGTTSLISSGGRFELGFFSPAGSGGRYIGIWYRNISQRVVWVANRSRPIDGGSGRLLLSREGTLVIATSDNPTIVWSSITVTRLLKPEATLFDDGNFAVREAGNDDPDSFAWQSFDFPTDTLLPGMKLGWDLTSGLNRKLTSWASADDPSPGNHTLGIVLQVDPQLFLLSGTKQLWRGGPWNGLHFSGAPDMDDPILSEGTFVGDPHRIFYSFGLRDPSTISVLVVDQSGHLRRLVWNGGGTAAWDVTWFIPENSCDAMSACGANALCNPHATPMCTCLAGFLVNSFLGWNPGNTPPYGCLRRSPWNCGNGAEEFRRIAGSKLPDTSTSVVDRRLNLSECRESCRSNCYCTAFASANISENGRGCITWMGDIADLRLYNDTEQGQDLYVRVGAFDLTDGSSNRSFGWSQLALVIVVPALAIFLLVCCIACLFCRRRCRKRKNCVVVKEIEEKDLDLPLFDLDTVLAATSNFAAENKLGQGGFGPVYKGKLVDDREIAVKRLSKTSTQGIHEFKNEVVIIAKLQHQNLVRLLGCCIQGGERMLIYEYMPNGSLDAFLFDEAKRVLLDWKTRYNIIVGIARGLLYLHHDSRLKIIHRDLKASNILLDKDNIPKISDFGLAKIFRGDEMEINTRRVVGTYGYMSPEYAMNGVFSIKSDVFSFGVLILEIVSGGKKKREVYNSNYLNFLGHIWSMWKEDKSSQIVDELIDHSFSVVEVMRCMKIGLLCVQELPQDRPTMSLVVIMLGSDCPIPEPKQPAFVAALHSSDSAIREQYLLSVNDVSNTTLEGR